MRKQLQIPGCPPLPVMPPESDYGQPCERRIVWALLHTLERAGFIPYSVDDGGEDVVCKTPTDVMEATFAVEEARVYFRSADFKEVKREWLLLIVGNGRDILSDYSCPEGSPFTVAMGSFLDRIPDLL